MSNKELHPGALISNVSYVYQYCDHSDEEPSVLGPWETYNDVFDTVDHAWDRIAQHEVERRGGIAFRVLEVVTIQSVHLKDQLVC